MFAALQWEYVVGPGARRARRGLPRRRPDLPGALLMSAQGILELVRARPGPRPDRPTAGPLHGACLRRRSAHRGPGARTGGPGVPAGRAVRLPGPRGGRPHRAALERLRALAARLLRRERAGQLPDPAGAGLVAAQPDRHGRRRRVRCVQRRRQLRDEHQLAVVLERARPSATSRRCSPSRCRTSCPPRSAWPSPSPSPAGSCVGAVARSATSGSTWCGARCGSWCPSRSPRRSPSVGLGVTQNLRRDDRGRDARSDRGRARRSRADPCRRSSPIQ